MFWFIKVAGLRHSAETGLILIFERLWFNNIQNILWRNFNIFLQSTILRKNNKKILL